MEQRSNCAYAPLANPPCLQVAGAVARDFKGVEDRMEAAEQAFNAMQDKVSKSSGRAPA
jgi:hypothetical protein